MLSEAERGALEDMLDNIDRATRFVAGLDLDAFLADDKTFYAATRCLEIISSGLRTRINAAWRYVRSPPLSFRGRVAEPGTHDWPAR